MHLSRNCVCIYCAPIQYEGEIDISDEATGLADWDSLTGRYSAIEQYTHNVRYKDNEHAVYSLYAGETGAFGYQAGLRAEYTRRSIRLAQGADFSLDRWDFFPTAHFSYSFTAGNQLMASYTRRIDRPGGRELEPFETWIDPNNVSRGNPSLLPEFIDSYEIGAQTLVGQATVSAELYHRATHNAIEDVRTVYAGNVTLTTSENVGTERSSGVEFLANFDPVKDWNVQLIGNLYDYRISGIILNEAFSTKSFNWSARFNNIVKATPTTQLQLNAMWNSPTVSPQGRREGFLSVDVAARQELLNKQLSLTLQLQNILGTARHEFSSSGPGFSSYRDRKMESPVVMLTLRLSINNYKPERERGTERSVDEGDY